jgi:Response regulator containing CheY-like receiver, AAA-type ATPase, and DNA-binding domains
MIASFIQKSHRSTVSLLLLGADARSLASSVGEYGIAPTSCSSTNEAVAALKELPYQAVLCDLKLPGAEKFMQDVRSKFPSVALLVYTQPGDLRGGILATLAGAAGYIQAPLDPANVTDLVHNALVRKRLETAIYSSGSHYAQ